MSKEKDITSWIDPHSNISKQSNSGTPPNTPINDDPGIDEYDLEHYEAIEALENNKVIPEPLHIEQEQNLDQSILEHNNTSPQALNSLDSTFTKASTADIIELLERIIFDEQELNQLKAKINEFTQGNINSKVLKKTILACYIRIFEDTGKLIPFFLAQKSKKVEKSANSYQKELEDKNKLLDQLALKLNTIYLKLQASPNLLDNESITKNHEALHSTSTTLRNPIEIKADIQAEVIEPSNTSKKNTNHIIYIDDEPYDAEKCYFVIDGANVALAVKDSENKAMISNLYQLVERLNSLGIKHFKVISDSKLYHNIDNQEAYTELKKREEFDQTPGGTEADYFILQYAGQKDAFIISNDMFRDHYARFGEEWIKSKRITFSFIDRTLFFDRM